MSTSLPRVAMVLVCGLLVSLSSDSFAQGVTTAAINGLIVDRTDTPLPGANIIAKHEPSGTIYGSSSRADGRYNLPNLRPGGPYSITVSLIGYQKQASTDIFLRLSQNLDLDFTLAEEAVEGEEVLVLGERSSVFNASRTGAASNVTRENIDRLPTISRNFQDYYKVSPYVSGDRGNVLGRNSIYNNIQIDGTNFNDLFGLGSTGAPAGQSNVTPISLDAIDEFQIVVSPYDVRQSGFTGAGINAVTRSGTNQYRGSVFYFGRNENLTGKTPTDVDSLKTKLANFTDYQMGGRVGGPIIENKLFFFVNGEITRFESPFSRTFGNAVRGTNMFRTSADSLQLLTNYLKSQYGYDPGSFRDIDFGRESDKIFIRFDYNLAENHKLTARWNYLRSSEDNSPSRGRDPNNIYFNFGKYKLDNKTHSVAVQLSSLLSNTMSNELIVGFVDQFDNPLFYGSAFPTIYIQSLDEILVLGAEQFRHRNELGQKTIEITNNFTYHLPNHTLTFGAKADLLKFRNLFIQGNFGVYSYSSIARFLQSHNPGFGPDANIARNNRYTYRYSATNDPLQEANWSAAQYAFYAQDEWTVSPTLKLTGGVRLDIPTYPDKPFYNARIDTVFGLRTDETPKTSIAVSPRLGFNWSVDPERNTQVRGGVGIFYGRFPYVWVSNQYTNNGVDFYTLGSSSAPNMFIADPFNQPKPPSATFPSAEVDITDRNFKAPSILRWNAAVDHKLPWDLVATLEGVFSVTKNDVYIQNINLRGRQANAGLTPGGKLAGEMRDVWGTYNPATRSFSAALIDGARFGPGVYLLRNTSRGSNANVTLQVQRSVPTGLNGVAAYTWGMAKDINSGNSATAGSFWSANPTPGDPNNPDLTFSQWDRRHRILGALSYRHEWNVAGLATTVGVFYNGQSGRPFSYLVSGDVNGDGQSSNDLAYVPRDANDIILMSGTGATATVLTKDHADYARLMQFIDGDDYLKERKGQISERMGPREPWSHQIDLRIAQEISTFAGHKLEITVDILNFLNLLNGEWGWVRNTGANQNFFLYTFHSLDSDPASPTYGRPRYFLPSAAKVTDGKADPFLPDDLQPRRISRWQLQFGLRYTI
jgi:outer membrane receptor protein involved in Fe transport